MASKLHQSLLRQYSSLIPTRRPPPWPLKLAPPRLMRLYHHHHPCSPPHLHHRNTRKPFTTTTAPFHRPNPSSNVRPVTELLPRTIPRYRETRTPTGQCSSSLLTLEWPSPPRNVLVVPKLHAPRVLASAVEFARHVHAEYPGVRLVFEPGVAVAVAKQVDFDIYSSDEEQEKQDDIQETEKNPTTSNDDDDDDVVPKHKQNGPRADEPSWEEDDEIDPDLDDMVTEALHFPAHAADKIDLVATFGGDGTILRAASLFSTRASVPPLLSFSMGTLGFLGEWRFDEHKRAWREAYMSGCGVAATDLQDPHTQRWGEHTEEEARPSNYDAWASVRGKSQGAARGSKILLRHRLKVGVYDDQGRNINDHLMPTSTGAGLALSPSSPSSSPGDGSRGSNYNNSHNPEPPSLHAINELVIHRGPNPHLAIVDVYVGSRFLTEAVADGILVSTPTGSTAYSLSAGGTIVHPLAATMLLTPICARTLSFRHLCLPLDKRVVLRVSAKNRGRELEVSIDGKRRGGVVPGMEIRVTGEVVGRRRWLRDGRCVGGDGEEWEGGVPCLIRSSGNGGTEGDDDGWVGGLNERLKFNYPVG